MQALIKKYKLSDAIPPKQEEEYNFAIHKSEQEKPVKLNLNLINKQGDIDRIEIMQKIKKNMVSKMQKKPDMISTKEKEKLIQQTKHEEKELVDELDDGEQLADELDDGEQLADELDEGKELVQALDEGKELVQKIDKEVSEVTKQLQPKKVPSVIKIKKGKIKKLGKIKIGKNLKKDTVAALILEPGQDAAKKVKKLKSDIEEVRIKQDIPKEMIQIGDTILADRMWPKRDVVIHKANQYYMNNRKRFIQFIENLYEPYKKALEEEAKDVSCDRGRGPFSLMTHQAIVRDYINLYSPYRGLLIYHGLGAGKTCSSIAIAEGMKSGKTVLVMTPASLRPNYFAELKTCGDELFRLNQFWEFISTEGNEELEKTLSETLNLPRIVAQQQGGLWIVNMKKEPNYESLSNPDKLQLNRQIEIMIMKKYQFINYNGINKRRLDKLIEDEGVTNPFDNKVVIVDEAHNFVGRIVNKLNKKDSLSYRMYKYLMDATNCKIVFLTGTPIINYPNEIGVLFNILRGSIKTFTFYIQTRKAINNVGIEKMFKKSMKTYDYIHYSATSNKIEITRNPLGFVSIYDGRGSYKGVKKNQGGNMCDPKNQQRDCEEGFMCSNVKKGEEDPDIYKCVPMSDAQFIQKCYNVLRANDIEPIRNPDVISYNALPDNIDKFKELFIDSKTKNMKNLELFQKRVLGLTSYFRSAQEQLMPRYDEDKDFHIVQIPMSDYQFGLYEEARQGERDMEKRNAKKQKKKNKDGLYDDSVSTYRIFSRAFCNFVFPRNIGRPKPKQEYDLKAAIMQEGINEDDLDATSVEERLQNIDGVHEKEDEVKLQEELIENTDANYGQRIRDALTSLKKGAADYLTPSALETYSPKFLSVLKNITSDKNEGLHLIYSQFRTLEGVGIISLILEYNGFAKFKIRKDATNTWQIDIPEDDRAKPMFALYTGTEDPEEKEIIRNVYNGAWDKIPSGIRDYIRGIADNNNNGEIIKVLMITSSGAEGINLKNTRFVHIIEPYWHPVRMEQVIGRARRICSHNELPVEKQDIKVFLYLMTFAENQLLPAELGGLATQELLQKDTSKIDNKTPLTSDEALHEISTIKRDINKQLLTAIKTTSIDCSLHNDSSDKDPVVCLSFGKTNPREFTTVPQLSKASTDKESKLNKTEVTSKYDEIKIRGKRFAIKFEHGKRDIKTLDVGALYGELYDYDSVIQLQLGEREQAQFKGYLRVVANSKGEKKVKLVDE